MREVAPEPEPAQGIPERLPLLDALLEERIGEARPLEGAYLILIQHQLGSMVPMTRALLALGADPKRIWWIDIPYTANELVRTELMGLGIPADHFSPADYSLDKPYERYQRQRVAHLCLRLRKELPPDASVLVLDDGSYLLDAMACFAAPVRGLRVVEQTTRGLIRIRGSAALQEYCDCATVVNVAESRPKKSIEGPLIGTAVAQALHRRLRGDLPGGPRGAVLVLGFGAIGKSVVDALQKELGVAKDRIRVLDPDPASRASASEQGIQCWDRAHAVRERFHLVIGCSGTTSFTVGDRVFLEDGAVLASASSGSAELSREAFIELADTHPADDIFVHERDSLGSRPLHSDIWLRLVDRGVRFLNGGFPVNFDGQVNCVPPGRIQATHTLQVGAAVEAMATNRRGLVDVSEDLCAWVERRYAEIDGA